MKVLNQKSNFAKLSLASALIGASLLFSACGGGDEFKGWKESCGISKRKVS